MSKIEIEFTDHAMVVRGEITLNEMRSLTEMAERRGFDLLDFAAGKPLCATLVVTNEESREALRAEIEERAKSEGASDVLRVWSYGTDTGISSLAIARVLSGEHWYSLGSWRGNEAPSDPSDLGRCIRLLDLMPGWRERLPEVAEAVPRFAPLVENWAELEALYREGQPSGPKCYARMKELLDGHRGNEPAEPTGSEEP